MVLHKCRDLLRNRKMTREVGGLLWWLSDDLVILGGLPLILVSANFVGRVFGDFCRHFTDLKMGQKVVSVNTLLKFRTSEI